MNTSATNPSMQPKVLSMSAGPKRARFWKYSPFVFLLVAGMGAFALDRVLRESDAAPGSPIERGPQPTALWESTYDKARSNNRNGPSEKIPVGALAPDFRLPDFADGHEVHLASFRGHKPVVLVFGSFSCNLLIGEIAKVKRLYEEHKDRADFLFVYVNEADHEMSDLEPSLDLLPKGPDNRRERVQKGRELLHFSMPTVLDTPSGAVQNAYDAFPRRLVVVDRAGRIAVDLYRGLVGAGWDFPKVESWLRENSV